MAVYGSQLNFFTELFRSFDYFSMQPKVNAGFTNRQDLGKVRGVFQYMKRGELLRGELLREEDTLADVNVPTLWTKQTLKVGNYFINKDGEDYRIKNPSDWTFEGGFNVYVLETIVGNTDVQTPHPYVDLGQNSYE